MKLTELLSQIKEIANKNGTSKPYLCGGVARDKYMGNLVKISDVDITTGDKTVNLLAQETASAFNKQFNVKQKTHEDGHLSIYFNNLKLDFSSNFNSPGLSDKLSDLQKEIYSRDFTCNALLLDFDLKSIIDPTGKGKQDIDNKIIRTCLKPEITLTSNKNRVVRAIYLACKLGFEIDQSIIDYVKSNPESIKLSSMKTLKEKLDLAFKYDGAKAAKLLSEMNLWSVVPISELMSKFYLKRSTKYNYIIKNAQTEKALQALNKLNLPERVIGYVKSLLERPMIGNQLFGEAIGFLLKNNQNYENIDELIVELVVYLENFAKKLNDEYDQNIEKKLRDNNVIIGGGPLLKWVIQQIKKDKKNFDIIKNNFNRISLYLAYNPEVKFQNYDLHSLLKLMDPEYQKINTNDIVYQNDKLFLLELTSPADLRTEGIKQNHCLQSRDWAKKVKNNECRIFSLREKSNPYVPLTSVQTDASGFVIRHDLGKNNSQISEKYKQFIHEWTNKNYHKYDLKALSNSDLSEIAKDKFANKEALKFIFDNYLDSMAYYLSRNTALTSEMLNTIYNRYKDIENSAVIIGLSQNTSSSDALLKELSNNKDEFIANQAKETLNKKINKNAYYQGTEQPTPKKRKYKPDPKVIDEPRFDEPFYKNYDLYNVPTLSGKPMGPGAGYHDLMKYKSVSDFLKKKRKLPYKGKERYVDSNGKIKSARKSLLEKILKTAIDFKIDEQISSPSIGWNNSNYDNIGEFGGMTSYTPLNDIDDKSVNQLNFSNDIKDLKTEKTDLYGLPDGLPEDEELKDVGHEQEYGTTDSGNTMYHNTWISS